ncbi:MAG: DAK2 domain-containing protein, partial [Dehalococcoidia bacterium]
MAHPAQNGTLTGSEFRDLVEAGARCLEVNVEAINALNVFPVPDGDTGINMLLTVKAALASIAPSSNAPTGADSVADVSRALARGALLGARGNSGVIFSQFMKGVASGLADCAECGGKDLRTALACAADAGYEAVGKPVEGTMLSVMRGAAEAVKDDDGPPRGVLRVALEAAERALAHTPEQLAVLKEAGVVDAGGQGVVAFLTGALAYLEGKDSAVRILEAVDVTKAPASVSREFLEHSEDEMYGYCTQFIILGQGLEVDGLRQAIMAIAGSTVVNG